MNLTHEIIEDIEKELQAMMEYGPDQKTQIRAWNKGVNDALKAVIIVAKKYAESEVKE